MKFSEYLAKFEKQVVEKGVAEGLFSKIEYAPVRPGRLHKTQFGNKIGSSFVAAVPVVIDYYGLWKKSTGFLKLASEMSAENKGQIKSLPVVVVHFASIRIETVAKLSPDLIAEFPKFKNDILTARGFHHGFGL